MFVTVRAPDLGEGMGAGPMPRVEPPLITTDGTSEPIVGVTPSENLACGAAEASSNGFFDVNNVPPWDIWVDFSERTLVSWVPPGLLDVAQMGIYVNPEACIRWAT